MNKRNCFNCKFAKIEQGKDIKCEYDGIPFVVGEKEAVENCINHSDVERDNSDGKQS